MAGKNAKSIVARPYTILVDTAEQLPYTFTSIRADADESLAVIEVPTRKESLGRHPNSRGDYTLDIAIGRCHVERKSAQDLIGTVLGYGGRRDRFESELINLAQLESSLIVVEATLPQVLYACQDYLTGDVARNRKILHRSLLAYMQDHKVAWYFAGNRRWAEVATFRFLDRFFYKHCRIGRVKR